MKPFKCHMFYIYNISESETTSDWNWEVISDKRADIVTFTLVFLALEGLKKQVYKLIKQKKNTW